MLIKNATQEQIEQALVEINKRYDNNIIFNRFDSANAKRTRWNVTLRTKSSYKAGHRLGYPKFMGFNESPDYSKRRRLPYACWHVHGYFFEELFKINPEIAIKSGSSIANPGRIDVGGWITIDGGNWQDRNIGSQMFPYYFSEACECEED